MYIHRALEEKINRVRKGYPVLAVTGARQTGKTTLLRKHFSDYTYINLESPTRLQLIQRDPLQFLQLNPRKVIIDEVQRFPEFLSYLQVHVDEHRDMGSFVISGSQNLLLSQHISQSLAGRVSLIHLHPFSLGELQKNNLDEGNSLQQMVRGFYPPLYDRDVASSDFYDDYIATYLERDVRTLTNISSLSLFRTFILVLAGRVGQVLNLTSLANDIGISTNSVREWLSILEASYLIYFLPPYYRNFGKRQTKSPKIYFTDTGVLCSLLQISTSHELLTYNGLGSVFENMVINEVRKHITNASKSADLFFFRDSNGNEVDILVSTGTKLIPVEIKAGYTFHSHFLKGINYYKNHIDNSASGFVVFGGQEEQVVENITLLPWNKLDSLFSML